MSLMRRWVLTGIVLGLLMAPLIFAPATWLAESLASATGGRLLLTETRGSLWSGSGLLVLTGGAGSRSASVLPGRFNWTLGLQGMGLALRASQDCCLNGEVLLKLHPGWGRLGLSLPASGSGADPDAWLAHWPAAWLEGLGTPWNTLQLSGELSLSARDFELNWVHGAWQTRGQLDFILSDAGSRISTLTPLGNYRLALSSAPDGASTLALTTLEGALQLNGRGSINQGNTHFSGEASATPGHETALNNLLNIIGRREGARSVISIG